MKQVFAVALFALFANQGQACHPEPPPPVVIAPPVAPPQQPLIISPQIHLPPGDYGYGGRGRGGFRGGPGGCINGRCGGNDWRDDDRRININRRNLDDRDFDQYADLRDNSYNNGRGGSISRSTSRASSSNINSKLSSSSFSDSFSSSGRGGCSSC